MHQGNIFFSPHSDDETLFGAFTIIKHKPKLVICFPSSGDYGDTNERKLESREAYSILCGGVPPLDIEQWDGKDLVAKMQAIQKQFNPEIVWAPSYVTSHPDHKAVFMAADYVFDRRVRCYHTYDVANGGKVDWLGHKVEHEPEWTERKLRALACYRTQLRHPRANQFFMDDLNEYVAI